MNSKTTLTKRKNVLAAMVGLFAAAGGASSAMAQGDEAATAQGRIDEIIVTANKREQSLQDTAMSITAIRSDQIERKNLVGMNDYLNSVPSVSYIEGGVGAWNQVIIRGIASDRLDGATVSSYFGEVPLTHSIGIGTATDIKLVDMERVEVLRGPQGTLYGSGAMGGTVRNIPVSPKLGEFEGKVDLGFGGVDESGDNNSKVVGIFNIPLLDNTLALRLVAYRYETAGYVDGVSTPALEALASSTGTTVDLSKDAGQATHNGGRATLLWKPSDEFYAELSYASQKLDQKGIVDVTVDNKNFTHPRLGGGPDDLKSEDFSFTNLKLSYDFSWGVLVASSTHFDGRLDVGFNLTDFGLSASLESDIDEKQGFVQELRLSSNLEGPLQYVAGLYYEDFDQDYDTFFDWFGTQSSQVEAGLGTESRYGAFSTKRGVKQKAVFGELVYSFTPEWDLTLGGRSFDYDRFDKSSNFFIAPGAESDIDISERGTSFKVNLAYSPSDDTMIYTQWTEGFRLGFGQVLPPSDLCDQDNDGNLDFTNAKLNANVGSDSTQNYELGAKLKLLDNKVSLSASIYQTDWNDIPTLVTNTSDECPVNFGVTVNAGEARVQGVEIESRIFATSNLQFSLSASYMETEFLDDGIADKGSRLPLSPRFSTSLGLEYEFAILEHTAYVRSDFTYVGDSLTSVNAGSPIAGDYGKLNLKAGMVIGQVTLEIYGNNLTNEDALTGIPFGFTPHLGWRVPPRVIGINVAYSF